jgi:hypothetical protein
MEEGSRNDAMASCTRPCGSQICLFVVVYVPNRWGLSFGSLWIPVRYVETTEFRRGATLSLRPQAPRYSSRRIRDHRKRIRRFKSQHVAISPQHGPESFGHQVWND